MPNQRAKNKKVLSIPVEDDLLAKIDQYAKDNKLTRLGGEPDRTAAVNEIAKKMLEGAPIPKREKKKSV